MRFYKGVLPPTGGADLCNNKKNRANAMSALFGAPEGIRAFMPFRAYGGKPFEQERK